MKNCHARILFPTIAPNPAQKNKSKNDKILHILKLDIDYQQHRLQLLFSAGSGTKLFPLFLCIAEGMSASYSYKFLLCTYNQLHKHCALWQDNNVVCICYTASSKLAENGVVAIAMSLHSQTGVLKIAQTHGCCAVVLLYHSAGPVGPTTVTVGGMDWGIYMDNCAPN